MNHEVPALWETALQEQDYAENQLADEVTALAVHWAGGDPATLRHATCTLAATPYLEGGSHDRAHFKR
jgi:hypothetical protein